MKLIFLKKQRIILFVVLLLGILLWIFCCGPLAPWQVVLQSWSTDDRRPSAYFGDYYFSKEECLIAVENEIQKKIKIEEFNFSKWSFSPGPPDPSGWVSMTEGYCGRACRDLSPKEPLSLPGKHRFRSLRSGKYLDFVLKPKTLTIGTRIKVPLR